MTEARARRAVVVGGSLGGLFAANLLHRAGWDVRVYERAGEELSGRGAGIITHPELRDALRMAGVKVDATLGVEVDDRVTLDCAGAVIGKMRVPQILTAWGRLYHLLKAAFPAERYLFGRSLEHIEPGAGKATACFAGGERAEGELVLGADGIRSTVRAQFLPQARLQYAGYVAWRGLAEEAALSAETHRLLFARFSFCLPPGEQMLAYPVAGADDSTEPGRRRYNFVWYRPAREGSELGNLLTDRTGRRHEMSVPPHLIRDEVIASMRADAEWTLAPQFAEVVRLSEGPFFQSIFDLESAQLAFGRVVLLGDAAFVARPHCGMGVTKAAGDAVALVRALASCGGDIDAALSRYDQERVDFGVSIVAHARRLGSCMQTEFSTSAEREAAAGYRTPESAMRETAVPPVDEANAMA